MVKPGIPRRAFLGGISTLSLVPSFAQADDFIDLDWSDLLPKGQVALPPVLEGLLDHTAPPASTQQPASMGVRTEWNQQVVRLPGYIVPIDYSGTGVTMFILVPFVGACVHVPPPPANQLVFVTTETPYESAGLFEAVNVTGMFGVAATSTQLADVAYAISADKIEPFDA